MSKEKSLGEFLLNELDKLRNCTHDWKEFGWKRTRDIKMLQCTICGQRKTVNTRIIKPNR